MEFLNQCDIRETSLGCKNHVYFGKFNGERKYKQRQYLLWTLRDILSMAISNTSSEQSFEIRFGRELIFSQLYDSLKLHKEYTFNSNISHTSRLCEICENSSLFAKGLNNRKKIFKENFHQTHMTWQKNLVVTMTRAIVCLKNVHFESHLKLLMI